MGKKKNLPLFWGLCTYWNGLSDSSFLRCWSEWQSCLTDAELYSLLKHNKSLFCLSLPPSEGIGAVDIVSNSWTRKGGSGMWNDAAWVTEQAVAEHPKEQNQTDRWQAGAEGRLWIEIVKWQVDAKWFQETIKTYMHACMLSRFSRIQLCATLWTAAHQAPLSTGFSRQECWSGLPFPSP